MTKAKKPPQSVPESIKKSVARGYRQGKFGSVNRRGVTSCDVGYTSMTGLDLASFNPRGITTLSNGAWAWHKAPEYWFERWVPKPEKGEHQGNWALRLHVCHYFDDSYTGGSIESATDAINAHFAHLDWTWPPRPRNT